MWWIFGGARAEMVFDAKAEVWDVGDGEETSPCIERHTQGYGFLEKEGV